MPTYQTTRITANKPVRANLGEVVVVEEFTQSVALVTNDTIQFAVIPKNAIVTDFMLLTSASLGSTANVIVGDAGSTNRLLTTSAATAASVFRMNNGAMAGFRYSADTTLYLTASSIASGTTGTVIRFVLSYTLDY